MIASPMPTGTVFIGESISPASVIGPKISNLGKPSISFELSEAPEVSGTPEASETPDDSDNQEPSPSLEPLETGEVAISILPTVTPTPFPLVSIQRTTFPTPSISETLEPFPTDDCSIEAFVVSNADSLEKTSNFRRITMVIQVAGQNFTTACELPLGAVHKFLSLSATFTLSRQELWYITSVEDGPPVLREGTRLVSIEEIGNIDPGNAQASASASPSAGADSKFLFPGSAILNITAFVGPLAVSLVTGPYVEYINDQDMVRALYSEGYRAIQWAGMIVTPKVADARVANETASSGGNFASSSGSIAAITVGTLFVIGATGFLVFGGNAAGASGARRGPILPA